MSDNDFQIAFDPSRGGLRIRAPYDGNRHRDPWVETRLNDVSVKGSDTGVTIWTYPDGQFIALELSVPYSGLTLEAWGKPRG